MPRRQTAKHTVQLQVLRHGEPFLSQVLRGKTLSIGPQGAPTIPTEQLPQNLDLLVPGSAGYGLRLAPPLNGEVTLPDRRLRIQDGLLLDPRPEPLVLGDGAGGTIDLGDGLSLVFAVHRCRHRFRRWSRPDPGLCAALALTCLVFAGTLLAMAPWRWQPRRPRVEQRLVQRPGAVIRLTRRQPPQRPAPPPGPTDRLKRRVKSEPRLARRTRRLRRKKAGEPSGRGVLKLLGRINKRHPGLLGQGDDATRRLLDRLDRSLASVRGPGRESGTGAGSLDRLTGLLGTASGDGDDLTGSVAATRLALPGKRARLRTPPPGAPAAPPREAIRKVVMAHGAEVRLCYEQAMLRSAQTMEGRLLLRWTIDAHGRASHPSVVRDTVGAAGLTGCVLKRIRGWIFPPCASGGCRVVYPFDFYPSRANQS